MRPLSRTLTLVLAAAAVCTAAGLYVTSGSFVLERLASADMQSHLDFDTFWRSAQALLEGRDIYATDAAYANLNPPIFTMLMAPLGGLEFFPAYRLWVLISMALIIGSMVAVARELRLPAAAAILVTVAVVLSSPSIATLGLGQIYPLLMAGLVAAWFANRRGRPVLEGVALGLTVALKPSLAPILLVPVVRREWLTFGAGLLAGAGATVLGWVVCGPRSTPTWVHLLLGNPPVTYWDNASLPGTVLRLTSASDWGRPLVEMPGGTVIGLVLGGLLLALTAWLVRRPPAGPDTAVWTMAAGSLLASPLSWHNYLLVLMPGVVVLVARGRRPIAALLLALALIGMEWPPLWYGDDGTVPALPVSLYCAILLAYWGALLQRPRPRSQTVTARLEDIDVTAPAAATAFGTSWSQVEVTARPDAHDVQRAQAGTQRSSPDRARSPARR